MFSTSDEKCSWRGNNRKAIPQLIDVNSPRFDKITDYYKKQVKEKPIGILREVEIYIQAEAEKGKCKVNYYKPLVKDTIGAIKKMGYGVEVKTAEYNEIYYVISWDEKESEEV